MKEVRTEQCLARFFKQHTRIPPVRKVRGAMEPKAVFARAQDILSRHAARGADGEIIHAHELADEGADRLGLGRQLQPLVERADFVGFKVTPGDVAEFRRINQRGHGFPQRREHPLESRVKEQRLLVANEEMVELHVELRDIDGEPKQVRGNFIDGSHGGAGLGVAFFIWINNSA